jgi:hypothetical protein
LHEGEFLYRECYFDDKKSLELEIPFNANLYYLSNEGFIQRDKRDDNYPIYMEIRNKWYSLIGFDGYIKRSSFEEILMKNINNFNQSFKTFFQK